MPGIVGLITSIPRADAMLQLERMASTLHHESFYLGGTWVEESLGLYIGWTARKGSFSDGMPLRNERKDIVLVFAGEEFPEVRTGQALKERGHDFDLQGPSYLVHLYEEDASFPDSLNGRFHGLVADRNRGTAVLFNDRYGMHRVYYHECKDTFYFAAEAKAILAVRPELRRLDPAGLGEFIACGSVLENRTLFEGIHVLPPGSAWVFRNRSIDRKGRYFQPSDWENQEKLDSEGFYQELRDIYARNLPRYFNGPERIAMSLTGGLDTRLIMSWCNPKPGTLPCYTFGGMLRDCHDVRVAQQVAHVCGQPHEIIRVGEDFLSHFSHYAERAVYLTDGCIDVGRAPDLYLNERAREIAPVRVTGNYGGEVLRRVRAFKAEEPPAGMFSADVIAYTREACKTHADLLRGHPVSFGVFKQAPWHHYGILALEETQLCMRSPFLDNDFVRTVFRAPESVLTASAVSLRLIADGNRALLKIPTDRGLAGERGRLVSVGAQGLLEFLFKAEYAYDMGMPQWVCRVDHGLSLLRLERLFLGRHKISHFRVWYRDALAGYIREMLLDPRSLSRPYIERNHIEVAVRDHLKGVRNYTNELHKLLTLEILHRVFLDGAGAPAASGGRAELLIPNAT